MGVLKVTEYTLEMSLRDKIETLETRLKKKDVNISALKCLNKCYRYETEQTLKTQAMLESKVEELGDFIDVALRVLKASYGIDEKEFMEKVELFNKPLGG